MENLILTLILTVPCTVVSLLQIYDWWKEHKKQ
jgi:hypothetical protein